MQNTTNQSKPEQKYYSVLYRDHNGEVSTVHNIISTDINSAGEIFKAEYKYCQYTIVAIIETVSGCNTYYPDGNEYILF